MTTSTACCQGHLSSFIKVTVLSSSKSGLRPSSEIFRVIVSLSGTTTGCHIHIFQLLPTSPGPSSTLGPCVSFLFSLSLLNVALTFSNLRSSLIKSSFWLPQSLDQTLRFPNVTVVLCNFPLTASELCNYCLLFFYVVSASPRAFLLVTAEVTLPF